MSQAESSKPAASPGGDAAFIRVACLICGCDTVDTVASSADLEAQQRVLQHFHQSRKRKKNGDGLADRSEFTQDYSTKIVTCRRCGFVFRSPRPTVSAVTEAYVDDRYSESHLQSEFQSQRRWATRKAAFIAGWAQFRKRPMIVEVGSFVGGFLDAGRRRGWSMLGVDPGKEVADFCRALGLPIYCGTLADAPLEAASVDAVAIWNTFDQLPNPDTTLAAVRRVLKTDGFLVIRVPNGLMYRRGTALMGSNGPFRKWIRKWMVTTLAWNNLLAFPYLHGYSITTLDQLLGRHGLARLMTCRDTLVTLSDSNTKVWARAEEKFIKWTCRCVAGIESVLKRDAADFTPWLDVYYGLSEEVNGTPVSVARIGTAMLKPGMAAVPAGVRRG
jgi:SAM-dependent methyltransferase